MKENYKNKLGSFGSHIQTGKNSTPIQKVQPVKKKVKEEREVQLNAWIPKSLMKRIKMKALEKEE